MKNKPNLKIPRKIWILWYQGLSEAPLIVKKCINSWKNENPNWDVIVLDKDNLNDYIDDALSPEKMDKLSFTKRSDLFRLQLLAKFGGVWADATTLCMKSLDDWIDEYAESGFFAFSTPGKDRILSSWFIAGSKDCQIIIKWDKYFISYFRHNNFNNESIFKQKMINYLSRFFNKNINTTRYWFSPIVTKILRIYPHFIIHYAFERIISKNPECQIIWNSTKKINADLPHKIQILGLFSSLNENIKSEIIEKHTPIYKLTLYYDHDKYSPSTLLYFLLEGRHQIKNKS